MNITPDLPYVDLTGFHTYAKPGFPFSFFSVRESGRKTTG